MITADKILVTQSAVCAALGISHTQVQDLQKKGIVIRPDRNTYDLIKSVNNYIKFLKGTITSDSEETDYYAERARLTKAQADERELKIQREKGELVPIETAERVWCDAAILLRNNILNLPNKISHVVAPLENPAAIAQEIKKEMIATLESVRVTREDYYE